MNRSGFAVRCLVERRHVPPQNALIVYDEVHLALGRMRLRSSETSPGDRRCGN
jgi:peptidyl-tRNA hydrolase